MAGIAGGNQPVNIGSTTGAVLSRHHKIFDSDGKITSSSEGLGTDAIVTTFDYTSDVLTSIRRTDGYFEVYRHTVDANNPADVSDDEERDVTIRPWKNQAFNSSLNEDQGSTTIVISRPAQGDWSRTIEKINGHVTSDSTSVSVDASVSHLPERPLNQPIRRTTTTRTVGSKTKVSVTERYRSGASPSLAGRLAKRVGEDGRTTIFHHYNSVGMTTGANFLQPGGWITYELNQGTAYSTESYQIVYDAKGREVYRETYLTSNSGMLLLLATNESTYQANGQFLTKRTNAKSTYSAQFTWNAIHTEELKTSETDAIGAVTTFSNFNTSGMPQTVTKVGFPTDSGLTAIPDQIIRYRYDGLGRVRREVRGDFVRETNYDSRGRLLLEIEGNGAETGALTNTRVTSHVYEYPAGGGSREIVTNPGGGTVISSTFADGQDAGTSGTATVTRLSETLHFGDVWSPAEPAGIKTADSVMEKSYKGGELESVTIRNGLGETTAEYILSFDASQNLAGSWRTFIYDDAGVLTSESVGEELVRTIVPTPYGSVETLICTPSPNQTRINNSYYVLAEPPSHEAVMAWWRISNSNGTTSREMLTYLSETGTGNGAVGYSELIDSAGALTTRTTFGSLGVLRQETVFPGITHKVISVSRGGLLQSSTSPAGGTTYYSYDALGRQTAVKSPALGANGRVITSISYDPISGQQDTVTTTSEVLTAGASTTTATVYYAPSSQWPGRVLSTTTDGRVTNQSYTTRGELHRVWGATYPQQYTYDNTGRLWKLHTYRTSPVGDNWPLGDVTEWSYRFGLLWKKTHAPDQNGNQYSTVYSYDTRGQLKTRTGGRGIVTDYTYNHAGQETNLSYNDGLTPSVAVTYDALGRVSTASTSGGSGYSWLATTNRQFSYDGTTSRVSNESFTSTPNVWSYNFGTVATLGGISRTYSNGQVTGTSAYWYAEMYQGYQNFSQSRTYSPETGLLSGLHMSRGGYFQEDSMESSASYGYLSGTSYNSGIARSTPTNATSINTTKTPDGIGRLKTIDTSYGSASRYAMTYGYDAGLRKTANTTLGDWDYAYNGRGELTGGVKMKHGVVVPGYNFGYGFDAIGNRTTATVNTHATTSTSTLTPNALNQLIARTVPGQLHIRGHVAGNATGAQVRDVNGPWIDGRPIIDGDFGATIPLDNSTGFAAAVVEVKTTTTSPETELTASRRAILPAASETITHDADGNMKSDALWDYEWDGENRLTKMTAKVAPWTDSPALMEFAYDWMSRRTHTNVKDGLGNVLRRTRFLWDGWNILGQSDYGQTPDGPARTDRTYVWGNDLSGSEQGAGGVGGLLAVHTRTTSGQQAWGTAQTLFPTYDGNGNIMSYINAATGAVEQEEEYGPFGENLRPRSTNILRCSIGWSTKYTDEETGIVSYQIRPYQPQLGRWMSRDPIGETGGRNLYGFIDNVSVSEIDILGLTPFRDNLVEPQYHLRDRVDYDPSAIPTAMDQYWWQYYNRGTSWLGLGNSMTDAVRAYKNYTSNTGRDFHFDYERAVSTDSAIRSSVAREAQNAQAYIEKWFKGQSSRQIVTVFASTEWNFSGYPETENWQKAIGDHGFVSTGYADRCVGGDPKKYSMTITFKVKDWYDFNPGQNAIGSGGPDARNARFETLGWATPFWSYGIASYKFEWNEGERVSSSDPVFKAKSSYPKNVNGFTGR